MMAVFTLIGELLRLATGGSIGSASGPPPAPSASAAAAASSGGDLSLNLRGGSRGTSAPSSPAKSRESLLQRVQSLTGAARDQGANLLGSVTSVASVGRGYNRDRCVTLLVVDDQNTDWSKYFRGRRLPGEWDIRVEQAEFRLCLRYYVHIIIISMSTRPDFVLVRQNVRDAGADHRALLLGLKFGGVPSINSLNSIYHFQDRPWVFGHLLQLQRRLGRENFPLIEQTYYHNHTDMVSTCILYSTCRFLSEQLTAVQLCHYNFTRHGSELGHRSDESSHGAIEVRRLKAPRESRSPAT
ncbi:hypothetical protein HF086_007517 [Spodoptera exigua]|uniref:Synapsin n=1 Tax=Spodoptera exigua TaxID=7107 RepID=A0A922M3E9_SPOEX|nr:hypothetical protein HF086_007517 [Spodoptera exigua]